MDELLERLRSSHTELRRPLHDQVLAVTLAEQGRWSDVPAFVVASRAFSERAGLRALPAHLDRLEGHAALHEGNLERAISMLDHARSRFVALHAAWERSVTELDLARALASAGRPEDGRSVLSAAAPDLERSGARRELKQLENIRSELA